VADLTFKTKTPPLDLPCLTTLTLIRCLFQSPRILTQLLKSFPLLVSLETREITSVLLPSKGPQTEERREIPPPFNGQFVMIDHTCGCIPQLCLFEALTSLTEGTKFSSIQVYSTPFYFVKPLNAVLKSCGPHLKRLDLQYLYLCKPI
jgi:hypothetical protein